MKCFEKKDNFLSNKVSSSIVNQLSIGLWTRKISGNRTQWAKFPTYPLTSKKTNCSELFSQQGLPFEWLNLTRTKKKLIEVTRIQGEKRTEFVIISKIKPWIFFTLNQEIGLKVSPQHHFSRRYCWKFLHQRMD